MNLSIKIIDPELRIAHERPCCLGEIQIGLFSEKFYMPVEWWTPNEYRQQWREGLKHIKTHETSCLVSAIQDPFKGPRVDFWALYKKDNIVYVQKHTLSGKILLEEIKKHGPLNRESCYNFVKPRNETTPEGEQVSEWSVELN